MTEDLRDVRLLESLTGESLLFGMLGKLLYTYPAKDWIELLRSEEIFNEAPFAQDHPKVAQGLKLLQSWSLDSIQRLPEQVRREVEQDYLELFMGMGRIVAPPWESVYLTPDRLVFQEPTNQVRLFYRRFGLEIERLGKEPDDHIGTELAFFGHLASLAAQAISQENQLGFQEILSAQQGFLNDHLQKWVPKWCTDVLDNATTDFYRGIALIISGALDEAAALIEKNLPKA